MKRLIFNEKYINIFSLILIFYMLFVRVLLIFSYSIDLDGLEFCFLPHIQNVIDEKPLYPNPMVFPYHACTFVPLYFYVVAIPIAQFNLSISTDLHLIYIIGRLFSLFFFIFLIFILLFYVRYRFKISMQKILVITTLYLLLMTGHVYALRPDALKLLFFSISFLLLVEYTFFNNRLIYLISFLFFSVLTVFTKQDSIIYLSVLIFSIFISSRNYMYLWLLLLLYFLIIILFSLMYFVYGSYFFENVILLNLQMNDSITTSINILFIFTSLARILPIVLLIYYFKSYKLLLNSLEKFSLILFSLLFVFGHILMLRTGSYLNYAFESIFVLIFFMLIYNLNINQVKQHNLKFFSVFFYLILLFSTNKIIHNYSYSYKKEIELKCTYFDNLSSSNKCN